jgi:hypothetical protein
LQSAFGTAAALPSEAHNFPYVHALSSTYCVEDMRSAYYNQIIDSNHVNPLRSAWALP